MFRFPTKLTVLACMTPTLNTSLFYCHSAARHLQLFATFESDGYTSTSQICSVYSVFINQTQYWCLKF